VRAYGLCIVIGVLVGVKLASRRAAARGSAPGLVESIAVWAVPAGIVGARLYHLITDFGSYRDRPLEMLAVWKGGLGIWGGVAAGAAVGVIVTRRRHSDPLRLLDVAAPGIAVAQAIGRFGNWFNQELFGRPTSLPWALRIDPAHRPDRFADAPTFHPTFLYESLWCLLIVLSVYLVERRVRLQPGQVFFGYVAMYTLGRWYFETLRVDPATRIAGFRVNELVAPSVLVLSVLVIAALGRRGAPATTTVQQSAVLRSGASLAGEAPVRTSGGTTLPPARAGGDGLGANDRDVIGAPQAPSMSAEAAGEAPRIGPPAGLLLAFVASVVLMAALLSAVLR